MCDHPARERYDMSVVVIVLREKISPKVIRGKNSALLDGWGRENLLLSSLRQKLCN